MVVGESQEALCTWAVLVAPQVLRILQEQKHQWGRGMCSPSLTVVRLWSWQAGTRSLLSGLTPVLTPGWPGACLDFSGWPGLRF